MKNLLILIDMQNDFIEGGSLAVPGGKKACEYVANWLNQHQGIIDDIIVSRDDHYTTHIGFPKAWVEQPKPFTTIKSNEVIDGKYTPKILDKDEVIEYLKYIETKGLIHTIWPEHCLHGSVGQQIESSLLKSLNSWSEFQSCNSYMSKHWETIDKGNVDKYEQYGIFKSLGSSLSLEDYSLISGLFEDYKCIYIAGIAKDVCVYHTLKYIIDVFNKFGKNSSNIILPYKQIRLLKNGIVGINESKEINNFYDKFEIV